MPKYAVTLVRSTQEYAETIVDAKDAEAAQKLALSLEDSLDWLDTDEGYSVDIEDIEELEENE